MLNRADFLKVTAATGLLLGTGSLPAHAVSERRGLRYRGVCYDVGTTSGPGTSLSREVWKHDQVHGDLDAIRDELHCSSVTVLGSKLDRMAEAATYALSRGLDVFLQPRLFEHPQPEILDHLVRAARIAERLRGRHPGRVTLVIGCEHMLFTPGIVPGRDLFERVAYITNHKYEFPELVRKLDTLLRTEVGLVRPIFEGPVTYGAAADLERVDWSMFDLVGLDYYAVHPSAEEHRTALAPFRRWQKPVMILEFGCSTFRGAAAAGGMGWEVIDFTKDPPEVPATVIRSESEQADHLASTLAMFETLDLYGASIWSFAETGSPTSRIHKYDYDIASYGLVKVIREDFWDERSPYRWLPKESFRAVARHNLLQEADPH